jgi:hypothetical protein
LSFRAMLVERFAMLANVKEPALARNQPNRALSRPADTGCSK